MLQGESRGRGEALKGASGCGLSQQTFRNMSSKVKTKPDQMTNQELAGPKGEITVLRRRPRQTRCTVHGVLLKHRRQVQKSEL